MRSYRQWKLEVKRRTHWNVPVGPFCYLDKRHRHYMPFSKTKAGLKRRRERQWKRFMRQLKPTESYHD